MLDWVSKVNFSDGDISEILIGLFDLRPFSIEKLFDLRKPIYLETAAYGHMGREPQKVKKTFVNSENKFVEFELELFNWEKLDYIDILKKLFMASTPQVTSIFNFRYKKNSELD